VLSNTTFGAATVDGTVVASGSDTGGADVSSVVAGSPGCGPAACACAPSPPDEHEVASTAAAPTQTAATAIRRPPRRLVIPSILIASAPK